MSPAKLAFQRKFSKFKSEKGGSPSVSPKSQKSKVAKFDEKWLDEMEKKSTDFEGFWDWKMCGVKLMNGLKTVVYAY